MRWKESLFDIFAEISSHFFFHKRFSDMQQMIRRENYRQLNFDLKTTFLMLDTFYNKKKKVSAVKNTAMSKLGVEIIENPIAALPNDPYLTWLDA